MTLQFCSTGKNIPSGHEKTLIKSTGTPLLTEQDKNHPKFQNLLKTGIFYGVPQAKKLKLKFM